ncbi:FCHO1 protein, partial [Cepphus grylle]|nr:FCHO1 protein [Cepphus grylle]
VGCWVGFGGLRVVPRQGEKNHGFDVLYHNMKHGQISTKELADFVRERAAIEENYAKAMVKLSKMATNGTQLGTFAPLWEVFRISSDKLALCHLELMKKLHDLIKEISRYGEEQGRVHKKSKEEVSGTLEAVQLLHGVAQLLPKSKESYHSKCQEYERLRKEGTSQKEIDKVRPDIGARGCGGTGQAGPWGRATLAEPRSLGMPNPWGCHTPKSLGYLGIPLPGDAGPWGHASLRTPSMVMPTHGDVPPWMSPIPYGCAPFPGDAEPWGRATLAEPCSLGVVSIPLPALGSAFFPDWEDWGASASPRVSPQGCPEVDEDGFTVRPDIAHSILAENHVCPSSDSDYDEDEPRKFYVRIKPVQPREAAGSAEATVEQLKATVGNLILPPSFGGAGRRGAVHPTLLPPSPPPRGGRLSRLLCPRCSGPGKAPPDAVPPAALFGPPLESAFEAEDFPAPRAYVLTSSSSPFSSSPENVEDSGLDSPSHPAPGPSPDSRPWTPQPGTPQSPLPKRSGPPDPPPPPPPGAWVPRPRSPAGRLPEPPGFAVFSGPGAEGLWEDVGTVPRGRGRCPSGPAPREAPSPDPFGEPLPWGRPRSPGGDQPLLPRLSRGPSPVVLGSQDTLPVATAFTEYVHAYFKGHDADSCLVKVTGELTMSFPAGIVRVFSGSMAPPVLSFRLLNAAAIEQFLPNAELLYSDPSQSDPSTKDFWLNMAALTGHLQKQAEQSPAASYYNVALLKYQFSRLGPGSAPLRLCVRWDCSPGATRVSVEYGYNAGALALPVPLANVHVLLPVDEPVANLRLQPAASWNVEEKRLLWRLLDIPGAPGQGGCGRLSASWEPLCGPSKPSPVAAQFSSEGSTLSGVEVELASAGYRMSLVKKRFATGRAGGAL